MNIKKSCLLAIAIATAIPSLSFAAKQNADVIVRHVSIIDPATGSTTNGQAVAIRGDKIVATGSDANIAKNWKARQSVEGRGKFIMPGMWDMHVHFGGGPELITENKALLPLYIANGITTVRDCSGDLPYDVLQWRNDIANGNLFGPTLYSSGPKIEGINPIWKGTLEAGSEADVDRAVAKLKELKVDFVKITDSTLTPDLYLYAIRKARSAGFLVSGHIPYALTINQAIDAGMSSIEHLDYAFKAGSRDELKLAGDFADGKLTRAQVQNQFDATFDSATALKAYRNMAKRRVFVSPTLSISRTVAYLDRDDHSNDPELAYIGPKLRATYQWRIDRAAAATPSEIVDRHKHFEAVASVLPKLVQSNVTIMGGTDAGFLNSFDYPGFSLHDELALYVRYGMTPAQALQSVTTAGPHWFGKTNSFGSVTKGKQADLILLDRNPLNDISATKSIRAVILRGKLYDRLALDAFLENTRARVAAWNALEAAQK